MVTRPEQPGLPCSNANEGHAAQDFDPTDGLRDEGALSSCTLCDGSDAKMRCSICGTRYCNRECYVKDWPHHKALCKTAVNDFNTNKAPTNHVRAILFPVDSDNPTWTWINLKTLDISIIRALGITAKKPVKKPANKLLVEDINKSLMHRKIGHGLRKFTAPNARIVAGPNVNRSIFALADPGSLRGYFASSLFIGFRTHEVDGATKVSYEDASPRDLRMIIEWYYTRPDNPCVSKLHRLPIKSYGSPGEEVSLWPAVRMLCDGDQLRLCALSGQPYNNIQAVQVLSKDVFENRAPCELAKLAGLPWVIQPCRMTLDPINDLGKHHLLRNWLGRVYAQGKEEAFMAWNVHYADGWELPQHLFSTYCGSILVMHKDGCRIEQLHVACFIKYIEQAFEQASPFFTAQQEEEGHTRVLTTKDELEHFITKERFEAFWQGFITARLGNLAVVFPSPYNSIYAGETDPKLMTEEEIKEEREKVESLLLEGA
ncbi:hypothetical protein GGR55DRAFT_695838 [Xylaria sp. FL0064]|nr:hypothetical protein GGR55DRAFT_695838 [Xylaria sp. FL0064]